MKDTQTHKHTQETNSAPQYIWLPPPYSLPSPIYLRWGVYWTLRSWVFLYTYCLAPGSSLQDNLRPLPGGRPRSFPVQGLAVTALAPGVSMINGVIAQNQGVMTSFLKGHGEGRYNQPAATNFFVLVSCVQASRYTLRICDACVALHSVYIPPWWKTSCMEHQNTAPSNGSMLLSRTDILSQRRGLQPPCQSGTFLYVSFITGRCHN